jgi:transmembrane sensor
MKSQQEIKEIIARINQGTASKDEIRQFQVWYNSFDDSQTEVDSDVTLAELQQKHWENINNRIAPVKMKQIQWLWKVAAAIVLFSAAVAWIWLNQQSDVDKPIFRSAVLITDDTGQSEEISGDLKDFLDTANYVDLRNYKSLSSLATGKGEFTKAILPDGTKVTLNVGSKISLSPDYASSSQRTISLEGEAYFEVTTIPGRSFVVTTSDQQIKVLGTKFNVKAYADLEKTITTLHEGKIELTNGRQSLILKPNDMVLNTDGSFIREKLTRSDKEAWRNLDFEFDNESIKSVLDQLSAWYGFEVVYQTSIPNQHISGKIANGSKTADVLEIMKNLTNGNFQLKGNLLYVTFANN